MIDFPANPTVGQTYKAAGVIYTYSGTGWTTIPDDEPDGNFTVIISDTPPTVTEQGYLWWQSDTGLLWLFYDDGNSTQWVQAAGSSGDGSGGGGIGEAPHDGQLYGRSNSMWVAVQQSGSNFVIKTGDTMTGGLNIATAAYNSFLKLTESGGTGSKFIRMNNANVLEVVNHANSAVIMSLEDSGRLTTGGGIQCNGSSIGFGGGGAYLNQDGANWNMVGGALIVHNHIYSTTGVYEFGTSGSRYLSHDGTNYILAGGGFYGQGAVCAAGDLYAGVYNANSGVLRFGNNGSKYLHCDGTNYNFSGGTVVAGAFYTGGNVTCGSLNTGAFTASSFNVGGTITAGGFNCGSTTIGPTSIELGWYGTAFIDFHSSGAGGDFDSRIAGTGGSGAANGRLDYQAGGGHYFNGHIDNGNGLYTYGIRTKGGVDAGYGGNWHNMEWSGYYIFGWVDNVAAGYMPKASDYRIKKDVAPLHDMWDTIKLLRPIKYTQKAFSPPAHIEFVEREKAAGRAVNEGPMFPSSPLEFWGFIAHELQETLTESVASGVKDSPNIIQTPDTLPLTAVLTKALQEAMARIEAQDARIAALEARI